MTTKKLTKLLALYLPYLLLGLVATNLGEAWRLAEGKELGDKIMSMMSTIPVAFANPLPSLHPLDLLVGLCCGAGLRLAVYLRGKNAKKYRHGMIEIYLLTSLAPIPFATVPNRETGHMGQNYFRSLFAVGFQGLLILVCVAIYAVLIQSIATDGDPIGAIWGCVGYTVLLCFTLFKTGSLAKSIFGCH